MYIRGLAWYPPSCQKPQNNMYIDGIEEDIPIYMVFYSKRALLSENYYSKEDEIGNTVFYRLTEWRDGTKEEKEINQVYMTNHF